MMTPSNPVSFQVMAYAQTGRQKTSDNHITLRCSVSGIAKKKQLHLRTISKKTIDDNNL